MIILPNSKGPNIHVIGAISTDGVESMKVRRGSYRADTANDYIRELVQLMQERGYDLTNIVLVCDNAPCHSRLEVAVEEFPGLQLLRLGPYSPMLNPIENVWSKLKAVVKRHNRVPEVTIPGVMEQRIVYLENLIEEAIPQVTISDCANAIQHASTFFAMAINYEDMPAGA